VATISDRKQHLVQGYHSLHTTRQQRRFILHLDPKHVCPKLSHQCLPRYATTSNTHLRQCQTLRPIESITQQPPRYVPARREDLREHWRPLLCLEHARRGRDRAGRIHLRERPDLRELGLLRKLRVRDGLSCLHNGSRWRLQLSWDRDMVLRTRQSDMRLVNGRGIVVYTWTVDRAW
jgi:hypothetical protein